MFSALRIRARMRGRPSKRKAMLVWIFAGLLVLSGLACFGMAGESVGSTTSSSEALRFSNFYVNWGVKLIVLGFAMAIINQIVYRYRRE